MSKSNIRTALRLAAAWNDADWEASEPFYWPDAELKAPEGWPEAAEVTGWPAIRQQFDRLKDGWAEDRWDFDSTEAVGEDVVLQHGRWHGRGQGSGLPFDFEAWILYRFRNGRITRLEYYLDRELAMAAADR
jgi:ketosteroid isomerase-like protein